MSLSRQDNKSRPGSGAPRGAHSLRGGSSTANRLAVAILEVLAGLRTPGDAAEALGISLPRYYQLEVRALEGLVAACESRRKDRQPDPQARIKKLEHALARAQAESARQQALVRAAQRAVGLRAPAAAKQKPPPGSASRRRKRRPTVRALKAVKALKATLSEDAAAQPPRPLVHKDPSSAGSTRDARTQDSGTETGPKTRRIPSGQAAPGNPAADADR